MSIKKHLCQSRVCLSILGMFPPFQNHVCHSHKHAYHSKQQFSFHGVALLIYGFFLCVHGVCFSNQRVCLLIKLVFVNQTNVFTNQKSVFKRVCLSIKTVCLSIKTMFVNQNCVQLCCFTWGQAFQGFCSAAVRGDWSVDCVASSGHVCTRSLSSLKHTHITITTCTTAFFQIYCLRSSRPTYSASTINCLLLLFLHFYLNI